MKLGSLCSGAGGLDMAVEQMFGAETVWHCEIDKAASKVLAHRWSDVPNHSDLINTDWETVEPIDILCAGWPCQPFSLAGKRKGAADERALWPHIADAVRILRPRIIVLENVSAVLGPEFTRVANDLAEIGYDIAWTCLRASDVGAPHRRERVFVLAYAAEQLSAPIPQGDDAKALDAARFGAGARDSAGDSASRVRELGRGAGSESHGDGPVDLLPTPNAADGARGQDFARANRDGSGGDDLVTLAVKADRDQQWGKYAAAITRWEHVAGPAPAPTEPNAKGNPRLNPAFSEWMMGWPAGWVTQTPGISRNDQLRIIGNGVCPQQAAAALTYLLNVCGVAA